LDFLYLSLSLLAMNLDAPAPNLCFLSIVIPCCFTKKSTVEWLSLSLSCIAFH
jgi:hypothetical protein